MCEELALKALWVNDRDTGASRQVVKEGLDVTNLAASAVNDPRLLHVLVVLLVQVHGLDQLAGLLVVDTTLLREVDNLERNESTGELSGSLVGVDVEDLALGALCHAGEDWDVAVRNGRLDGLCLHIVDLANELVGVLVLVLGPEHAAGDRPGADSPRLQCLDQLQVLFQEQLASNSQGLSVGDTDALVVLRLNASLLELLVKLRASAVDDDWEEAHLVEVAERRAELVQVVGQDGTADLDHGKLLRLDRGELGQVLLDLTLRGDVVEDIDHSRSGGAVVVARLVGGGILLSPGGARDGSLGGGLLVGDCDSTELSL